MCKYHTGSTEAIILLIIYFCVSHKMHMNNMATVEDKQQFNAVCDGTFSHGGG